MTSPFTPEVEAAFPASGVTIHASTVHTLAEMLPTVRTLAERLAEIANDLERQFLRSGETRYFDLAFEADAIVRKLEEIA